MSLPGVWDLDLEPVDPSCGVDGFQFSHACAPLVPLQSFQTPFGCQPSWWACCLAALAASY
eukprot:2291437-Prorocentrum_lima.AAC.1